MSTEEIISLQGVCKRLGGQQVLDGLDLTIRRGETVVIMGRSGVGKSVVLKHIVGLMRPDSGRVLFYGEDINRLNRRRLRECRMKIGMLFQSAALFDSMTVSENVGLGLLKHTRKKRDEIARIVEEKLEEVGLAGTAGKMPVELSGGMRKRVGLARALAMDPEVVLYDEPTTGLDPITAEAIDDLILEARRRHNVTGVVVTHEVHSALKVATRVCLLDEGRIAFDGEPDDVRGTGQPVMRRFLQAVSAVGN